MIAFLLGLLSLAACQPADTTDLPETNYYAIDTPLGHMVVRLYDETPLHRDNFKRLAAEGFYDGATFHRVIAGFMIQGGDPNSRNDDPRDDGQGGPGYTIPAEIRPEFIHKRGALAAARQGDAVNPERASSGSQFYVIQGRPLDSLMVRYAERQVRQGLNDGSFSYPDEQVEAYVEEGGYPTLDRQYTIFGELVEGFDVLNLIANVNTPNKLGEPADAAVGDQPFVPIPMTVHPLPDYTPPAAEE